KNIFGSEYELDLGEVTEKTRYRKIFTEGYGKRVLFVGIIWTCQIIPMFAIYTFGPQILSSFGLESGNLSILGDIVISFFFMAGCLPAMFWMNSVGRRSLCIGCFFVMLVALLVLGLFPNAPLLVIIGAFAVYAIASGGPGVLEWLYPNELFPTSIRASAVGAAMGISRVGSIIATYLLPSFLKAYGISSTMFAGAGITLFGLLISVAWAPETTNLTLSESSSVSAGRR
ncbi:MAG: MFS transporter, partial [Bacillota bacterium]|nr:MFS transporter [Bacillota bacterium]